MRLYEIPAVVPLANYELESGDILPITIFGNRQDS
jgi:hypothetical protein